MNRKFVIDNPRTGGEWPPSNPAATTAGRTGRPHALSLLLLLLTLAAPALLLAQSGQGMAEAGAMERQSSSSTPFLGSIPEEKVTAEPLSITFSDAIERALRRNLGETLSAQTTAATRGEKWKELSALLPNVNAAAVESVQKANLQAMGLTFPGVPEVIGPFAFFDARAYLTQTVFDWKAIQKYRAASEQERGAQYSYRDARELVVLATGNAYLLAIAAEARVEATDSQVNTAKALFGKTSDQQKAGISPGIDTLRANVELQIRQQQLIVARNDFAKQKLVLARVIGLAAGQHFTLASKVPYEAFPAPTPEEALQKAYAQRPDYQAAVSRVASARLSAGAAKAGYYPSFNLAADFGEIGTRPNTVLPTFHASGGLQIPIFQGGRVHGDVLVTESNLRQTEAQLADLRGRIDQEVRVALLDLASAADQVEVARSSVELAEEALRQSQDRFTAGVTDNLEVVQAQESVATAHDNFISSLYQHNVAKVSYARAIGRAEAGVKEYLKGK